VQNAFRKNPINYRPFRHTHVLKNLETVSTRRFIGLHSSRSEFEFRMTCKGKPLLAQLRSFTLPYRQLCSNQQARRCPRFSYSYQRRLLAGVRAKLLSNGLNRIKRNVAFGLFSDDLRIEREFSGDYVHH
jgi:hypothetical protein